jgi:tetratricopeptide (TPR) repeat protein
MLLHRLGDKKNPAGSAETKRLIKDAMTPLERAVERDEADAETYALLSVLTGIEIARKPVFAPMLGPRFLRHKKAAIDKGPENPRVHYLLGTSYYHGPDMLGGKEKALEAFLKAETLFAKQLQDPGGSTQPLWGRSSCLTFIGKTYAHMGQVARAKEYYDKALSINPNDKLALECADQLGTESTDGG